MTRQLTSDFYTELQKGNIAGHSLIHKFGRNDGVPNGSWAFINMLGFTAWPLSAATTVRIKAGGDAADTAAGNGAREITVQGIDDSFNEVTEVIATAGASASSATTTSFWRVHRAWVSAVGVYGAANTDVVVIENSGGGTDLIQIGTEEGQSQFGGWTVPLGKTAYLLTTTISVDSNKSANIAMYHRKNFDDTTAPMSARRLKLYWDGVIGVVSSRPRTPGSPVTEKSDIWFEAFGGGAGTEVSVDFEILVVEN